MMDLCQLSQSQLLDYIHVVSFAVNDITLFLDSHPEHPEALAYFQEHSKLRNAALREYARRFGPLTINFIVVVVVGAVDMWICHSKPDYYWIFLWDNSVKTGWIVKG